MTEMTKLKKSSRRAGLRDAQANLTRSRGVAEDVHEV